MKNKTAPKHDLLTMLESFSANLSLVSDEASRAALLKRLDATIEGLGRLRDALASGEIHGAAANVAPAVAQVIAFMESAKRDERLAPLLGTLGGEAKLPKREPIKIPADLTNLQIRELLERDLSADELRAVATQRAISPHGLNRDQLKRTILDNLKREEGYQRLAQPT